MKPFEQFNQIEPEKEIARVEDFIASKRKNIGFNKGIIGLSGGIDSSLTAVLAKRALSDQNIEVLFLPETTTPDQDLSDVRKLQKEYQLEIREIEIDEFVSVFKGKLGEMSEMAKANLKARIRMVILYAFANQTGGLVLGTGNLSEWLLGYFTKYGDGAADLTPLIHLYKTEIKAMASHLDIPDSIISKPPSAGLWEGQKDEEELGGSYEDIDKVLYLKHEKNYSLEDTKTALDLNPNFVKKIFNMVTNSSHKRGKPKGLERS